MTIDEFIEVLQSMAEEFGAYWQERQATNPENFPEEYDDEAEWWEQFSAFLEMKRDE